MDGKEWHRSSKAGIFILNRVECTCLHTLVEEVSSGRRIQRQLSVWSDGVREERNKQCKIFFAVEFAVFVTR
jgi:hypothetical protein